MNRKKKRLKLGKLILFIVSIVMGYVGNTEWKNCWTASKDVEVNNGTIINDPLYQQ